MSVFTPAPPARGAWYTDMEPWRRPVQLSLPILEYESDWKVWEWRIKLILKHKSLLHFVLGPVTNENFEEAPAATYCAALLSSCISEQILADILTLSSDGKLPEDPHVIFERTMRTVKAVQMVRDTGSIRLRDVLFNSKRPDNAEILLGSLQALPRKDYTIENWRNIILVTALLFKRYNLVVLTSDMKETVRKAFDEGKYLDENDFKSLTNELMVVKGRK